MNLIATYLAVCGGAAAGAQVARGAVRGAARLARGDTKGALAEAAGGLAAPVASAVRQLRGLADDVRRSAAALNPRRGSTESAAAPGASATPSCRRRASVAAAPNAA
jgi:hypothetical protein